MASNIAGLIREGVAAFKAGRKEEAHRLLERATELAPEHEEAWLWLSAVVDTLENQKICLENVLALNPNNARAQKGLEMVNRQLAQQQQPPPPPPTPQSVSPFDMSAPAPSAPASFDHSSDSDPFGVSLGTSPADAFSAPPADPFGVSSPPSDDPFASASFTDRDAPAHVPAFHGSGEYVDLPSDQEYDDWVDGLNLGVNSAPAPPATPDGLSGNAFDISGGPFQRPELPAADAFAESSDTSSELRSAAFGDLTSPGQEPSDYAATQGDRPGVSSAPSPADEATHEYEARSAYDDSDTFADTYDSYAEFEDGGAFSSASPFGGMEGEGTDYEQASDDLMQYFDYIPEGITATYLPDQIPTYPRGVLIGLAVVSGGIALSLITTVVLLLTR